LIGQPDSEHSRNLYQKMKKNCSIFFQRFQLSQSSYSFVSMEDILFIGAAFEHTTEKTSSAEWVF
jgi:hypothetical protein